MRNQASFVGAASAVNLTFFGPFPRGTKIRLLQFSIFGTSSGVSAAIAVGLFNEPQLDQAAFSADGKFLTQSSSAALSGTAPIPAIDVTSGSVPQNLYLNEVIEDMPWVGVAVIDNGAQNQYFLSLDATQPPPRERKPLASRSKKRRSSRSVPGLV